MMSEYVRRHLERRADWGRIINVSTDAHAHPGSASHAAAKHAIESYSRSAALEFGRYGVTVNIVAPGPIKGGRLAPEQESTISAGTPLGLDLGMNRDARGRLGCVGSPRPPAAAGRRHRPFARYPGG
jgi:NAD(P)-dependent dehydrogenase (short-subunit alcohol dehydrogenase family)